MDYEGIMTDKEILERAIQKAQAGGWFDANVALKQLGMTPVWALPSASTYRMIFNHDFAKALWGETPNYHLECPGCELTYNHWEEGWNDMPTIKYCNQCGTKLNKVVESYSSPWRDRLRGMVIADDPIKYLGEHI